LRDSVPIDMLLSAVYTYVLVVAQSSSEVPEGLMNNPVYVYVYITILLLKFLYLRDSTEGPKHVAYMKMHSCDRGCSNVYLSNITTTLR